MYHKDKHVQYLVSLWNYFDRRLQSLQTSAPCLSLINLCIYRCLFANACECVCVCTESSTAPGKGKPAKRQMVCINVAKSSSLSTSTTPTWLPTVPCVYSFCTVFAEWHHSPSGYRSGSTHPSDANSPHIPACFVSVLAGWLCMILLS